MRRISKGARLTSLDCPILDDAADRLDELTAQFIVQGDALSAAEREKDALRQQVGEALEGQSERDAIKTLLSDRSEPGTYMKVEAVVNELEAAEQRSASLQQQLKTAKDALALAESVYRQNVVVPGEPSSVLDAIQSALAALGADTRGPQEKKDKA